MIENLVATLLASVMALSSYAGAIPDKVISYAPQASAQVSQSTNNSFDWNGWGNWRGNRPIIRDIEPDAGPVGTTITLSGRNFDDDNIVRFGDGAIHDPVVSENGRTLSFTVPSEMGQYCPPNKACTLIAYDVEPGDYRVRVQDGNRTSNTVSFEVTEEDTSDDLKIVAIDGPTSLDIGEEGTWTVDAESNGEGNLHYSVTWGDEGWSPMRLFSSQEQTQSSATFTHTYHNEGTYYPEFTVTNESGDTVTKVSAAVVVGDEDEGVPHISSITPDSGSAGTEVTLLGHAFDNDSTVKLDGTSAVDVTVVSDSEITFEVPTLDADTYEVRVTDSDGTSNMVTFTVTHNGSVSISGIDAPTRLEEGQEGTWTVHADTTSSGNLQYSVDWGEGMALRMSSEEVTQSSATFTHTYEHAGTYHPTFTVTDAFGNSQKVSASVVVDD